MKLTMHELELLIGLFPPYSQLDEPHKNLLKRLIVSESRVSGSRKIRLVIASEEGRKVPAIKAYRKITGLGLKEAKEAVDRGTPIVLKASEFPSALRAIKDNDVSYWIEE